MHTIYWLMNTNPAPMQNTPAQAIERWLAIQLSGATFDVERTLTPLRMLTPSQRVVALHDVLGHNRDLAWETSRLPVLEQLRLSLDLVRAAAPISPHTRAVAPTTTGARCRAPRPARSRAR